MIDTILIVVAVVSFIAVALKFELHPRVNLLGVGLAAWALTALV